MNNKFISAEEVKKILKNNSTDFIIADIREPNEYIDWNIKGSINIPVNSLLANGDYNLIKNELKKLPTGKKIVTVCMRGINSQVITSILGEMGYNSYSLQGGMKGWNENYDIFEIEFDKFTIVQFARIGKGCLSYIIISNNTKCTAVIEPSIFTNNYIKYITDKSLDLKFIIDTHSHADHFSGGMALAYETGIDYYINSDDVDGKFNYTSLRDINRFKIGDISVKTLKTPGHTDGSLSFLIENKALLCGDLLLLEDPGRPDLARTKEQTISGAEILFDTLQNIIFKLDESVMVFPSHFTKTEKRPVVMQLGELKKNSKPLQMTSKRDFIEYLTSNIPLTPPNFESIKKFNKAGAMIPLEYAEDLEIGPNRCAAR